MVCPPLVRFLPPVAAVGGGVAAMAAGVAAQPTSVATHPSEEVAVAVAGDALGSMLWALLALSLWVVFAPDYSRSITDWAIERPGSAFLYGVAVTLGVIVVAFLLVITVLGILVAIPLLLAVALAAPLGFLAVGRTVTDSLGAAVLVGVVVAGATGLVPVLGGIVGFVCSCLALGGIYLEYTEGGDGRHGRPDRSPTTGDGDSPYGPLTEDPEQTAHTGGRGGPQPDSGRSADTESDTGGDTAVSSSENAREDLPEDPREDLPADRWNESVEDWDWGLDDDNEDDDEDR